MSARPPPPGHSVLEERRRSKRTSSSVIIIFGQPELADALMSNINTVNINVRRSSRSQSPSGGGMSEWPGLTMVLMVGPLSLRMRPSGMAARTDWAIVIHPLIQLVIYQHVSSSTWEHRADSLGVLLAVITCQCLSCRISIYHPVYAVGDREALTIAWTISTNFLPLASSSLDSSWA